MVRGMFRPLLVVAALAGAGAFSLAPTAPLFRSVPAAPQRNAAAVAAPKHAGCAAGRARLPLRQHGAAALRAQAAWSGERVTVEGKVAKYTEELEGAEVGVIQAAAPLTPKRPYYEIKIDEGGSQNWIGIGLATKEYVKNKQPGWDLTSVGFHADDGSYYRCPIPDEMSKSGRPNNMPLNGKPMPCEKGDIMGIGLEFDDRGPAPTGFPRRVYFTKNKQYLGSVLLEKQFHPCLYPTIGFNSPGAKVSFPRPSVRRDVGGEARAAIFAHVLHFLKWAAAQCRAAINRHASTVAHQCVHARSFHPARIGLPTPVLHLGVQLLFFFRDGKYAVLARTHARAHTCTSTQVTIDMECDFASVLLAHTAQFFGTNEYATDITTDSIAAGAEVLVCVCVFVYIYTHIHIEYPHNTRTHALTHIHTKQCQAAWRCTWLLCMYTSHTQTDRQTHTHTHNTYMPYIYTGQCERHSRPHAAAHGCSVRGHTCCTSTP